MGGIVNSSDQFLISLYLPEDLLTATTLMVLERFISCVHKWYKNTCFFLCTILCHQLFRDNYMIIILCYTMVENSDEVKRWRRCADRLKR